jgi:hypothetical protein
VLLRECADKTGLTSALSAVMPSGQAADWWDRGVTLVGTAVAIVLGAVNMSDVERLWVQQSVVFGAPASDSTIGRTLTAVDEDLLAGIAKARARVRRHVWSLLHLRPGGFPWLVVAGKRLTGWIVIDLDATLITSHSVKDGAAVTFKKTFGFQCAMRRSGVFPVQPGGTWKEVPGPDDLPELETVRGPEHVRKLAAMPRRCGWCARRPA